MSTIVGDGVEKEMEGGEGGIGEVVFVTVRVV